MSEHSSRRKFAAERTTSKTKKESIRFSHSWIIENFSFFLEDEIVSSPTFNAGVNDGIEWQLELHPNGENERIKDYVSVFLDLCSTSAGAVLVDYDVSIVRSGQDATQAMCDDKPVRLSPGEGSGFKKLIKRSDLFRDRSRYLPGNKLTIRCNINYVVEGLEDLNPISPIQPDVKRCAWSMALWELLEKEMFSDVVLLLNGFRQPAHRVILSAASPAFRALFEHSLEQGVTPRVEITGIDGDTLFELLRYIYTGQAKDPENMRNLLAVIGKHVKLIKTKTHPA